MLYKNIHYVQLFPSKIKVTAAQTRVISIFSTGIDIPIDWKSTTWEALLISIMTGFSSLSRWMVKLFVFSIALSCWLSFKRIMSLSDFLL